MSQHLEDYKQPECPFCLHEIPALKSDGVFIEHRYSNGPVSWVCPGSGTVEPNHG